MNFLHIYAQPWQHSDAWIVGNRAGLTVLRDALNRALASEKTEPAACLASVADGEGYACFVVPNDADWQDRKWTHLYEPYTDETAQDHREDVLTPFDVLGNEAYRRLYEGLREKEEVDKPASP